ncbi:hypothetical protein [Baaleninema sp.]|uniref:hypothetical protein n=1 Tax=Baaleninema sp. TaxID=3101197 RepID=UPI003CFD3BFB
MSQTLVLHDSDGGIDDYLSTLLLMTMENFELLGVVITPADCYFWDVLATAYLGRPDLYELREYEVDIITEGPSQGRTIAKPGGRPI